ncbi:unnamed protein product [Candida verbasci]|uniref:Protein kinase domain-containing protein n=1 Tax=Candida verbasci TaxID=1227364 RepID=A0A9W4TU46_9ASCO|nr:unnamed protein product [Candida verbasci]
MPIIQNFKKLFNQPSVPIPNTTTSTSYTTVESKVNKPNNTDELNNLSKIIQQSQISNSNPELSLNNSNESTTTSSNTTSTMNLASTTTTTTTTTTNSTNATRTSFSIETTSLNDLYPDLPSHYQLQCLLGEGAFSTVYKAIDIKNNNLPIAIKIIDKSNLNSKQYQNIINEINIMKKIRHKNLLKLISSIQTTNHTFLILEYCNGGEIFNKIIEYTYFSEDLSRHIFSQLLSAISSLHASNIVHRDIKPENLLFKKIPYMKRSKQEFKASLRKSDDATKLDEGEFKLGAGGGTIGIIKLADFGLAKQLKGQFSTPLKTPCGTAGYTAPEVITCNTSYKKSQNYYDKSVDVWSLGCFLYTMLCGFPPFYDEDSDVLTMKILNGDFVFLKPWWDEISDDVKDLITKMLEVNPEKRITIDEIYQHKWIKKGNQKEEVEEESDYFATENIQESSDSILQIPSFHNQPLNSPRANQIKKVFDNQAMYANPKLPKFTEPSSQFIEDIEEEAEEESPHYVKTPFPQINFKDVFKVKQPDDDDEEEDEGEFDDEFDEEISELDDEVHSLQLTPKLSTRRTSLNSNIFTSNFAKNLNFKDEDNEFNSNESSLNNSDNDTNNEIAEYQTRSSSIISGINGDYKFTMNLNDSNLLARRKSSTKGRNSTSATTTTAIKN